MRRRWRWRMNCGSRRVRKIANAAVATVSGWLACWHQPPERRVSGPVLLLLPLLVRQCMCETDVRMVCLALVDFSLSPQLRRSLHSPQIRLPLSLSRSQRNQLPAFSVTAPLCGHSLSRPLLRHSSFQVPTFKTSFIYFFFASSR